MASLFSGPPSIPAVQPAPPAAAPPTMASPQVAMAGPRSKAGAAVGAMMSGTVGTSPQGLTTPVSTGRATLLGGGP